MPINYFQRFPKILYNFGEESQVIRDITHKARILELVQANRAVFYSYTIRDGETAWEIAHKYYGDPRFHWVVFYTNNTLNPYFDWPMSYNDFNAWIMKEFGDIPTAYQTIHHYEDGHGSIIDLNSYTNGIYPDKIIVSSYDYYFGVNESKRTIQLLDKVFLSQIDNELDAIMSKFKD